MRIAETVVANLVFPLVGFVLAAACATSPATDETAAVEKMQRELLRLKSENTNLKARTAALDDQQLLAKVKQDRGASLADEEPQRPELKVVKLTPDQVSFMSEEISAEVEVQEHKDAEGADNRPVLRLSGGGSPVTSAVSSVGGPGGSAVRRQPPVDLYLDHRGDNLGVLSTSAPMDSTETSRSDEMSEFHVAYRSFTNREYSTALTGFAAFLRNYPEHEYADNALFWRGECYMAEGKMLRAVGEFERLLARYPRSEKVPSSLYRIGFVYDQLQDQGKAREYYFKVVEQHPGSEAARKASRRMATLESRHPTVPGMITTSAQR